jgi:hypothetical protein
MQIEFTEGKPQTLLTDVGSFCKLSAAMKYGLTYRNFKLINVTLIQYEANKQNIKLS